MEPMTLWLVWTLLAGQPVDVNSYLTEDSCKENLTEAAQMLSAARAQHPNIPAYALIGCQRVLVTPLAARKET